MDEGKAPRRLTSAPKWAAVVLAAAVLVLVALTALAARGLPGSETRPPPFPLEIDLLMILRIMLGIMAGLIALLVILLLLPGGPPIKLPPRKKASPFKLLAAIVLFFVILVILQPFAGRQDDQAPPTADAASVDEVDLIGFQQSGSRWGLIILAGAVLLVVFGVAMTTRPEVEVEANVESAGPEIVTGVIDAVLAELEGSADPREVVIAAYARMERALRSAGLPRHPSEAPLEYLARSLRRLYVTRPAVTRLTRLFEIARFSDHVIGPEMGEEAVESLQAVRDELTGVAP
jgi:hypothetical protein